MKKTTQEVAKGKGRCIQQRPPNGIICGIQRHLDGTVGNKVVNPLDALDKE